MMKRNSLPYATILYIAELAVKAAKAEIQHAKHLTTGQSYELRRMACRGVALTLIDDAYYDCANNAAQDRLRRYSSKHGLIGGGKSALLVLSGFDDLP
jgi:hypothetical protein